MTPKPLRLRKRRDGTLCVCDAEGNIDSPDREFPAEHWFSAGWLIDQPESIAKLTGDTLTLTLANGKATYKVTSRRGDGVGVTLQSSDLYDAPDIDEDLAAEVAERVAEEQRQERIAAARRLLEEEGE